MQKTQIRLFGGKKIFKTYSLFVMKEVKISRGRTNEMRLRSLLKSIILEPEGRNTAPAIAIAALKAMRRK